LLNTLLINEHLTYKAEDF